MFHRFILTAMTFLMLLVPATTLAAPETESSATMAVGHGACAGVTLENPMTPDCANFIAANPHPPVSPLPVQFGVLDGTSLLQMTHATVAVYDAPGGNQIDTMETGYTYFAPLQVRDGYAQLSVGRWIRTTNGRWTSPSSYSGVAVNGGLQMPFAWILWGHHATSTPAGYADRENGYYARYQVVNIYATVNINGWDWHLIGPNHWTNQRNLSIVFPGAPSSFGGRWTGINLYEQNLVAYENNQPVMATLVSSGLKNGRWDTPTGTYSVGVRLEADRMAGAEGDADYYSLDQVPYAQYFNGLISLHGTYWHDSFGYPQSHGCVNVSVSDSYWLFNWLGEGSTVFVYDR